MLLALLERLRGHYRALLPRDDWERGSHPAFPPEAEDLPRQYCRAAFSDTASMRALLEFLREPNDEELQVIALNTFAPGYLRPKQDSEMLAFLLGELEKDRDIGRRLVIQAALINLETSALTQDQIRLILRAYQELRPHYLGSDGTLLMTLVPHTSNPEVRDFLFQDVSRTQAAHSLWLLAQLPPHDREAYEVLAMFLARDDLGDQQSFALDWNNRNHLGGDPSNYSAENPLAADFVARLQALFATTNDPFARRVVAGRTADFDMPQAAEAFGRYLRDDRLSLDEKSEALLRVVTLSNSEKENLYPRSKDAWLGTLEGVGSDPGVTPKIRANAYVAWLAVVNAQQPLDLAKKEILRVVSLLETDPNPEMREAGVNMRERAERYGLLP